MTDLITELQHSGAVRTRPGERCGLAGLLVVMSALWWLLGVASWSSLAGRRGSAGPGDGAGQGGCVLRGLVIGY